MGTNYYLRINPCEHCGRADEEIHIGKSSGGWCFSLHIDKYENLNSLYDWINKFKEGRIFNEYNEEVSEEEMINIITKRSWKNKFDDKPYGYTSWEEFHRMNNSEIGPNGLLRHKIDGRHCVGHGDGTYDYIKGVFF